MKKEKLEIDFFKELKLPQPIVCGLVNKVISPKGIRQLDETGRYKYHLKDEIVQVYDGKPAFVNTGIFWIMDIYKKGGELKWNHYLVIVEDDCFYPVAEFLEATDSTWIKSAIPFIKRYFEGAELDVIQTTRYKAPKQSKRGWGIKN